MPAKITKYQWLLNAIQNHNSDECLIWPHGVDTHGYGQLRYKGNGKCVLAHRLAFFISNGHWPKPEGMHSCDRPLCFNPRHILEGSHADNMGGAADRKRFPLGERHFRAKLSDIAVRQIMQAFADAAGKVALHTLAKQFGVCKTTVQGVLTRKHWDHIPYPNQMSGDAWKALLGHAWGEKHGKAKLTEAMVAEIRAAYSFRQNVGKLAAKFGVHPNTIRRIAIRKLWKR